jgi:3-hydroxyisobutyrate dehydrogenase-like beta-hydroxyacid dehydrogenase
MKVGFIGLGKMGAGMVRNLLRAGHELTVYNRTREKAAALEPEGARVADSPAAASGGADAVITMLADDAAVAHVVFGEDGIANALAPGALHISSSTISTALARRLAAAHGTQFVSAPVFGRPDAAESKRLLVVAGGPADVIDRCRPLFDAVGRQTFVAGTEPWQANAVKLCGNFMIASMLETFGEAYATLRKSQVDSHLFLEVMNALFASPVYAGYGKIVADRKFEPAGFALTLGLKDVRLVLETARECASPMPVASVIHDHLLSGVAQGMSEKDWAAVSQVIAKNAGLE